ncbi:MAG: hypothetical protein K0Q46_5552 [Rhodococcus erythropolis]|jgi:hypothetical protein|nr:hypothetical protein [Rhodococcus erythropolis]
MRTGGWILFRRLPSRASRFGELSEASVSILVVERDGSATAIAGQRLRRR